MKSVITSAPGICSSDNLNTNGTNNSKLLLVFLQLVRSNAVILLVSSELYFY